MRAWSYIHKHTLKDHERGGEQVLVGIVDHTYIYIHTRLQTKREGEAPNDLAAPYEILRDWDI